MCGGEQLANQALLDSLCKAHMTAFLLACSLFLPTFSLVYHYKLQVKNKMSPHNSSDFMFFSTSALHMKSLMYCCASVTVLCFCMVVSDTYVSLVTLASP